MRVWSFFPAFFILIWSSASFAGSDAPPVQDAPQEQNLPFSRDLNIEIPKLPGLEDDFLKTPAPLEPPTPEPETDSASSDEGFTLRSIKIEGATLYKASDFLPVYKFFLGKFVSFNDLDKITRRIETFYTNAGWLAAKVIIPRQQIANGQLKLQVFEGKISDIVIEGDAGNSKDLIHDYLASLKTGKPGRLSDLENGLFLLQDLQHLAIRSRLRLAETEQAGGVDLVVNVVDRDIFSGTFSLNSVANKAVGPWVGSLNSSASSLFFGGDRLSLSVSNSILDPKETLIGRVSYQRLLTSFLRPNIILGIYVGGNLTRPDPRQQFTGIEDKDFGASSGLYMRWPLYRSRDFNMQTSFEYDFERRKSLRRTPASETQEMGVRPEDCSIFTIDGDGNRVPHPDFCAPYVPPEIIPSMRVVRTNGDMHILSVGFDISGRVPWYGYGTFAAKIRQGLTEGGGPDLGRVSGCCDFRRRATWITMDASYNQALLPQLISAPSLSLFVSGQGQYAIDPLPNSHQISFGNSSIGRGYSSGGISNNHGFGASTELRAVWSRIPPLDEITLYSFLDQGTVLEGDDFTDPTRNLLSTGFGARARFFGLFYVDLTWARALRNPYGDAAPVKGNDGFLLRAAYFF